MSVVTMAKDKVRIVMNVPEEVRIALRNEAQIRGVEMGDIFYELVMANPDLAERVEEIRRRRKGDSQNGKGGRK